jgi:hypothetical protein
LSLLEHCPTHILFPSLAFARFDLSTLSLCCAPL